MRELMLVLLLGAALWAAIFAGLSAYRRASRAKWQISLRGMFGIVTVVAVLLAMFFGYRRMALAQLRWLPPGSTQAKNIFPVETVALNEKGEYEFSYYARRRHVRDVLGKVSQGSLSVDREAVRVTATDRTVANEQLQALGDSNILPAGVFVIRGRVVDRKGDPLRGATVDLMGPFVFINHFQTRDDGTFTMPLTDGTLSAPASSGYYLRIRAKEETAENPVRWESTSFSLDTTNKRTRGGGPYPPLDIAANPSFWVSLVLVYKLLRFTTAGAHGDRQRNSLRNSSCHRM